MGDAERMHALARELLEARLTPEQLERRLMGMSNEDLHALEISLPAIMAADAPCEDIFRALVLWHTQPAGHA